MRIRLLPISKYRKALKSLRNRKSPVQVGDQVYDCRSNHYGFVFDIYPQTFLKKQLIECQYFDICHQWIPKLQDICYLSIIAKGCKKPSFPIYNFPKIYNPFGPRVTFKINLKIKLISIMLGKHTNASHSDIIIKYRYKLLCAFVSPS